MHHTHRITFLAATAALFFSTVVGAAEEPVKKEEAAEAVIVGNPPPDSPFGKLKIGMKYEEVIAIVGKPTSESSWCTGKQNIPFYFGDDRGRAEAHFKGLGKLDFNATVSMYPFRICKGNAPLDLVYIEYNPETTGEQPK
ncbi:MAG: hypothetical protein HGA71_03300 [Azonexaceae bacterium]|nr:hypothetical protein [Azonexaceae bacterium]